MSKQKQKQQPREKTWVINASDARPIMLGKEGPATLPPITVPQAFKRCVELFPEEIALASKPDGVTWETWSYRQYYAGTREFAKALIARKLLPLQVVSILGYNAPEWFLSDIGTILAGGIATGIYTSNGPEACKYILDHSETRVLVLDTEAQLNKIIQVRSELPALHTIIQWSGVVPKEKQAEGIYSWDDFIRLGENVTDEELDKRINALKPELCCTLVYTSGTTGPPKATMLSHDNLTWTAISYLEALTEPEIPDRVVCYLPLSHVAAQITDMHLPMRSGMSIWFAPSDALKGNLGPTLRDVRPTLLLAVPRVYEKMFEKIREVAKNAGPAKTAVARWAKRIGATGNRNLAAGRSVPWGWWLASKLVFENVHDALGLDHCRCRGSSAAPMSAEVLEFFNSINLPITEGYGLSECSGPATFSLGALPVGSNGAPMPGVEIVIDQPDAEGNGEILIRGRSTFMGYLKNEDATKGSIDDYGFVHSGDIGKLERGELYITGRIKELIITAGGENIPPVLIETELIRELGPVISNAMVIGDKRKFLACIFTLKAEPLPTPTPGRYPFSDKLAADSLKVLVDSGITGVRNVKDAQNSAELKKWIEKRVDIANKRAASHAQQIRKFFIADEDFALENDTLTTTLKLKRRIVLQRYGKKIDHLYEEADRSGL